MAAANVSESAKWCDANLTADDAKVLIPLFAESGVVSVSDILLLSKDDLTELKVSIGTRNRLIAAQEKAKPKPAPAAAAAAVPDAPPAPVPVIPTKVVPGAAAKPKLAGIGEWSCPACTLANPVVQSACGMCGTRNPNPPAAPPPPAATFGSKIRSLFGGAPAGAAPPPAGKKK